VPEAGRRMGPPEAVAAEAQPETRPVPPEAVAAEAQPETRPVPPEAVAAEAQPETRRVVQPARERAVSRPRLGPAALVRGLALRQASEARAPHRTRLAEAGVLPQAAGRHMWRRTCPGYQSGRRSSSRP